MIRKYTLDILLFPVLFLMSIGTAVAETVVVSTSSELVVALPLLSDGDTLKLTAGTFLVDEAAAVNGLIVATTDYSTYKDVTIIGEGMSETIIDFGDSYGFYVYFADDLLIKDMTIKNATKNGGVYVQNGNVDLENIKFDSCRNVISGAKVDASGGAVCYDWKSTFNSISGCVFTNNYAEHNGGAIAFMNNIYTSNPLNKTISRCQIYNNDAGIDASAVYIKYTRHYIHFDLNAIFNNQNHPAVVVNGSRNVFFSNNSIALNPNGGVYLLRDVRARAYFTGNAMVSNGEFDCAGANSGTLMRGNHNVASILDNVSFSGYFNEELDSTISLFEIENDSLNHKPAAAEYLAGRLPESEMFASDLYGQLCVFPADLGAVNFDQGGHTAIWTGNTSQEFFDINNWRNGIMPLGNASPSAVSKIIISNCEQSTYPIISSAVTPTSAGNLSESDMLITPTGMFMNEGSISLDTLIAESQNGGLGEFVNSGTLDCNKRLSEYFVNADQWVPLYIPESGVFADALFPGAVYDADYEVKEQDEDRNDLSSLNGSDVFSRSQGYWVKSEVNRKALFNITDNYNESFTLDHTAKVDTLDSGWNMIGNPYDASVSTEFILANAGNAEAATGAIYTFDGSRYKVWVDGVGDSEAQTVGPHEAFYVQALDSDAAASPSTSEFVLDVSNITMLENPLAKSTAVQREGLLTIGLATSSNAIYDRAYVRFKDGSTEAFDYSYDAKKLGRLEELTSAMVYTNNEGDDIPYAVNTQVFPEGGILSIPLRLDYDPTTITSSQSQRLRFSETGGDSVSYLLHDIYRDSSLSIEVTNGRIYSFTTGTSASVLLDRFSLQVFDGAIPNRIVSTNKNQEITLEERAFTRTETRYEYDTLTLVADRDTIQGNGDSLIELLYMVDSIYVDTTYIEKLYIDSIYYDSIFTDTTRVWGTHEYTSHDTLATSYYTRTMTYGDVTDIRSGVYYNNYIIYESFFPVGIEDLWAVRASMKVYSYASDINISSELMSDMLVKVYDMSGTEVRTKHLSGGSGKVEIQHSGLYIVRVEQDGHVFNEKVIINK